MRVNKFKLAIGDLDEPHMELIDEREDEEAIDKNEGLKQNLYEAFQSVLAFMVRFEILMSPIGLIFRNVDYARDEIKIFFDIIAYFGILFIVDAAIRSVPLYRELKAEKNWLSKFKSFSFIYKASFPVTDLIVAITRLGFLADPKVLKYAGCYIITVFRVIRWFSGSDPIGFWVGLSKLD